MSYCDRPSGWHPLAVLAALFVHLAVLALAVWGPSPMGRSQREAVTEKLSVFAIQPQAKPRETPEPDTPSSDRLPTRMAPVSQPLPSAVERPLALAPQPAAAKAPAGAAPVSPSREPEVTASPQPPQKADPSARDARAAYAAQLRAAIQQRRPRGLHKEGVVEVLFSLDPSGRLLASEVTRSSGDVQMDRMALRMVRQAAPFLAPPEGVSPDDLLFRIPVNFH